MHKLPQSKGQAFGQVRKRLLAWGVGALVSALAFGALAHVACSNPAVPVYAGVPVNFNFAGVLPLWSENYTISWGDGTVQTGNSFANCGYYCYFGYTHSVDAQHIYSTPATAVRISVRVQSGESCSSNAFDVLPPLPPLPLLLPPLPLLPPSALAPPEPPLGWKLTYGPQSSVSSQLEPQLTRLAEAAAPAKSAIP